MADDLDDEWWIEDDKKDDSPKLPTESSDSESEREKPVIQTKKRKLEKTDKGQNISDISGSESEDISTEQSEPLPKKKKKKRKGISQILASEVPKPLKPNDLVVAVEKYYEGKLSVIEVDEVTIKETSFAVCNDLSHTPTSYLKTILPKWKKLKENMSTAPGCPLVLIITSAAIRAVDLIRQISDFRGNNCKVGKLFAKHMKLEEQNKFLKKSVIHIGVGTPNRLYALLEAGSLQLNQVKYIVLDWSWRDIKFKRLIDSKEIKTDFMKLLRTYLIPQINKTKTKLALL